MAYKWSGVFKKGTLVNGRYAGYEVMEMYSGRYQDEPAGLVGSKHSSLEIPTFGLLFKPPWHVLAAVEISEIL